MATEEAKYQIIQEDSTQNIQIRTYAPTVIARVETQTGQNSAFRLLFKYITGENTAQANITMTSPVTQQNSGQNSQKIAMTIPVTQQKTGEEKEKDMVFFLPPHFTINTAPQPINPRIMLVLKPEITYATRQFSGVLGEKKAEKYAAQLRDYMNKNNIIFKEPYLTAAYDAPFKPWFLRRNEVWFEVVKPLH